MLKKIKMTYFRSFRGSKEEAQGEWTNEIIKSYFINLTNKQESSSYCIVFLLPNIVMSNALDLSIQKLSCLRYLGLI